MSMEYGGSFVSRPDWTFDRHIERDDARHKEKVKEAIRNNLGNVVSDGDIITADPGGKRKVKVPMRAIELPHIRYGEPKDGIGMGDGSGNSQPGQPVPGDAEGEAGTERGEEAYETEMTIDEIQALVFEDLGLPNIKPKGEPKNFDDVERFDDIRKRRTPNNLDIGRTALENIMRNARETGVARVHKISAEDIRVRTWEQEPRPKDSAVVIAMADISGSMGEFEKYVTRAFCWWTVSFLRTKYPHVDIVFLAHDTEAYEVSEEQFFSRRTGGGTKCSSVNRMANDLMQTRYQPSAHNVYTLHFSDGDNLQSDNQSCVDLVNDMLGQDIAQYAYLQIGRANRSQLLDAYERGVDSDHFKGLMIKDKGEVLDALKKVFALEREGY